MARLITPEEAERRFRKLVDQHGSQRAAAKSIGCSEPLLSRVLNGRTPPTSGMLKAIGVYKETVYLAEAVDDKYRVPAS